MQLTLASSHESCDIHNIYVETLKLTMFLPPALHFSCAMKSACAVSRLLELQIISAINPWNMMYYMGEKYSYWTLKIRGYLLLKHNTKNTYWVHHHFNR